jgi:hypothetical protein
MADVWLVASVTADSEPDRNAGLQLKNMRKDRFLNLKTED